MFPNLKPFTLGALLIAALLAEHAVADTGTIDTPTRLAMTELVEMWIKAEVEDDAATLERILHEDFVSTFASGKTVGRAAYIDIIIGMDIPPFAVTNESMTRHGDTVVVIDVSDDGTTKFTWIAIHRNDTWRVIAQTFSRISESGSD